MQVSFQSMLFPGYMPRSGIAGSYSSLVALFLVFLGTSILFPYRMYTNLHPTNNGESTGNRLQYSCLEKSYGRRSLVGCSPWGHTESDMTERLHFPLSCIGEGNGNPLQCSCLENPRDRGSLVGCHLWGCTELDTTEAT